MFWLISIDHQLTIGLKILSLLIKKAPSEVHCLMSITGNVCVSVYNTDKKSDISHALIDSIIA